MEIIYAEIVRKILKKFHKKYAGGGETGEGEEEGARGGEEGSRPGDWEGEQLLLAAPNDRAGEADRREEETKGLLVAAAVVPISAAAGGEQHWMPWRSLTCWMRLQAEVSWAVHRAHRK